MGRDKLLTGGVRPCPPPLFRTADIGYELCAGVVGRGDWMLRITDSYCHLRRQPSLPGFTVVDKDIRYSTSAKYTFFAVDLS